MAYAHSTTYSSAASGTWVAPQNGQFLVETWGGGGGAGHYGRTTSAHAAGGGGGGAYANTVVTAVSGVGYSYYVAAGGANGANNANGNAGLNTQFNNFQVIAAGGQRGNNTGAAGAGGTVANSAGTNRVAGGAGAANAAMVGGGGGAGGGAGGTGEAASGATGGSGANGGGAGGAGGASNTAGTSGSIPGGAGGAAGGNLGTTFKQSGSGNNGRIIISYNDTIFATITCPATDSALRTAKGQKSGTIYGVASLTNTITAKGQMSGTISGVASDSASLSAKANRTGTISGIASLTATWQAVGQKSGQSDGVTSESASLNGKVNLSGTIAPLVTATGTLIGKQTLQRTGTINAVASLSASLLGKVLISGTVNAPSFTSQVVEDFESYAVDAPISGNGWGDWGHPGYIRSHGGSKVLMMVEEPEGQSVTKDFNLYDFDVSFKVAHYGLIGGYSLGALVLGGDSGGVDYILELSYIYSSTPSENNIVLYIKKIFEVTYASRLSAWAEGDIVRITRVGDNIKIYCNGSIDTAFGELLLSIGDENTTGFSGNNGEYTWIGLNYPPNYAGGEIQIAQFIGEFAIDDLTTTQSGYEVSGSIIGKYTENRTGTINGVASLTGTRRAVGQKSGSISGVATPSGIFIATGQKSGQSDVEFITTGVLFGRMKLRGSSRGVARVKLKNHLLFGAAYGVAHLVPYEPLTNKSGTETLVTKSSGEIITTKDGFYGGELGSFMGEIKVQGDGIINGIASLTAGIQAKGNKNGTITGVTLLTGTLTAKGILSGSINGLSSNSALRTAKGQKSGIISGTASLTGTLLAKGSLATVTNGVALLTGLLTAKGNKSGVINGVALLTGALIGKGLLAGQVNGLAYVTGTLVSPSIIEQRSGIINGLCSVLAILSGRGNKTGLSSGVSVCYAILSGTGALSGNCPSLSSVLASLSGRGRLMALTSGQAMTQSNLTMVAVVRLMAGQTEINFVDTGRIKGIGELEGHSDSMSIVMMTILIAYGNLRGINNVQVESFCINVTNDVG